MASLFEDGYWMQSQNYEAPSDKTLAVMKFTDMDGKLIAAILNYACHATSAFCTQDVDGKGKMSSGFPGIACDFVEERYGNGAIVMWTSGAAGNQNPMFSSEGFPRVYEQDGYSESVATPPGTQFMIQRHNGQTHAIDAIRAGYIINDASAHHKVFQSYSKVHPGKNDQPIVNGMMKMFYEAMNK